MQIFWCLKTRPLMCLLIFRATQSLICTIYRRSLYIQPSISRLLYPVFVVRRLRCYSEFLIPDISFIFLLTHAEITKNKYDTVISMVNLLIFFILTHNLLLCKYGCFLWSYSNYKCYTFNGKWAISGSKIAHFAWTLNKAGARDPQRVIFI
jgi:hypothetical protein